MSKRYRHEIRGSTLIISNCNPKQRNSLSPEFYQGLLEGLAEAATDPLIAAVVLVGEGAFFCSGGDLNTLKDRRAMPFEARQGKIDKLGEVIRAVRTSPKPVIAAVEGGAVGAGVSLAMACDMIVAAKSAKFTLAYVKVGLVPDGGATYALTQALPRARQWLVWRCLLNRYRPHACSNWGPSRSLPQTEPRLRLPVILPISWPMGLGQR